MGVITDPWLDDQAAKLHVWIEKVVQAVITRQSPEGAAGQDEQSEKNKAVGTPR